MNDPENFNRQPFNGNNRLAQALQVRLQELRDNFNPYAVRPSLNNRQFEDTIADLDRFSGNFVYVHVRSGTTYHLFVVRDGGEHYSVDVPDSRLDFDWQTNQTW